MTINELYNAIAAAPDDPMLKYRLADALDASTCRQCGGSGVVKPCTAFMYSCYEFGDTCICSDTKPEPCKPCAASPEKGSTLRKLRAIGYRVMADRNLHAKAIHMQRADDTYETDWTYLIGSTINPNYYRTAGSDWVAMYGDCILPEKWYKALCVLVEVGTASRHDYRSTYDRSLLPAWRYFDKRRKAEDAVADAWALMTPNDQAKCYHELKQRPKGVPDAGEPGA